MKISGAKFMDWWDNHFPEGYYWDSMDDMIHNPDGSWKLEPSSTYNTHDLGYVAPVDPDKTPELETDTAIRRWLKTTTHHLVTVSIPNEIYDEIVDYLEDKDCKVKK